MGSFIAPDLPDIYIWIRRFESDEERASTGAAVYESEHWINVMRPRIDVLMDREKMVITRLEPTAISPLR